MNSIQAPSNRPEADLAEVVRLLPSLPDRVTGGIPGGRRAALAALAKVDPAVYTRTRNFLDGAVSRLSPYLRHGVLTLAEVRDFALAQVARAEDAEKFVNELGWRDYWQRLYRVLGEGVWQDREPMKTGHAASAYAQELPEAMLRGTTGLACMDGFSNELRETGYLHNHARMWVAAYVVHWLRVRWQAGARWFLEHLLDGDPASNNLSWQWVASTFSNKPYFFNRENLERYTNGVYCRACPLRSGGCPFDATYEELEPKLFRVLGQQPTGGKPMPREDERPKPSARPPAGARALLWIHTDGLSPEVYGRLLGDRVQGTEAAQAVFVWDEGWLRESHISSKRAVFLEQCLQEMQVDGITLARRKGGVAAELLDEVRKTGAGYILAQRTADPRLLAAAAQVERTVPVVWVDVPPFADDSRGYDLKRFSRYWQKAQSSAMRPTAG